MLFFHASFGRKCLSSQVYTFLMRPNCMILRCKDPSFHWAASIKSIYSTKPRVFNMSMALLNKSELVTTAPHTGRLLRDENTIRHS